MHFIEPIEVLLLISVSLTIKLYPLPLNKQLSQIFTHRKSNLFHIKFTNPITSKNAFGEANQYIMNPISALGFVVELELDHDYFICSDCCGYLISKEN